MWQDGLAAMPDIRHDVQEAVVVTLRWRASLSHTMTTDFAGVQGTGRCFRIDQAVITHLSNGKVIEAWEIADVGSTASASHESASHES